MSDIFPELPLKAKVILNDEEAIRAAYHLADEVLEERDQRDFQRLLPQAQIESFSLKGLGAIRIPKAYGGAHVSHQTLAYIFRILSKADANVGQIPQNQFGLLNFIQTVGSEQQKQFIYQEILGGKRVANGGPEKNAAHSNAIETTLTYQHGKYYLDGKKFYSTGAIFADWLAVRAIHPNGYSVLSIIPRGSQGVEIIDDWDGFGQRTTASGSVILNHVEADPFLFFDERHIQHLPNTRGAFSQLIQVAIDVGIAEAAFHDTLSAIRKARPIVDAKVEKASQEAFVLQEVGRLNIVLDAAILLLGEAAAFLDQLEHKKHVSKDEIAQASIVVAEAKVYANDAALSISEKLFELGGSRSSLQAHHYDQHWRNARVHTLHDPVRWKFHAIGDYYLNHTAPARHAWI